MAEIWIYIIAPFNKKLNIFIPWRRGKYYFLTWFSSLASWPQGKEASRVGRTHICHSNNNYYQISCLRWEIRFAVFRKQQVCGSTQKETVNQHSTGWRSGEKICVCACPCVFMQCQRDVMLIINNIALVGSAWRSQSLHCSLSQVFSEQLRPLCVKKKTNGERCCQEESVDLESLLLVPMTSLNLYYFLAPMS